MKSKLLLFITLLISVAGQAQFDIVQPGHIITCSNNDFAEFNLTTQNSVILDGLPANNYTITYHTSSAAANGDFGAISNASWYTNTSNPQPIWARVEQISNPSNYEIAEFHLVVNLSPPIYDQEYSICDLDENQGDGMTTFDLEAIAEQLWSQAGVPPDQVELTFYLTEIDAVNMTNPLSSPFTSTTPNQMIFVNSIYYATGCYSISTVTLEVINCAGNCSTPTNLSITNVGGEQATFSWTAMGEEEAWEILILYSGGPFPLPTMDGIIVENNPVTIVGIECPESYDVYIRAVCEGNSSAWSMPMFFSLQDCEGGGGGQPINLTACAIGGTACFDLTVNDAEQLDVDSFDYELSYYTSMAAAEAGTAPLTNPEEYCTTLATGADEIFIRIEHYDTGEFEVVWFTVTAQEILTGITLPMLTQCDEDGNGSIIFNLLAAELELDTDNELAYYNSLEDAMDENDPIANAGEFEVTVPNPAQVIYIRETVIGGCDIIHSMQVNAFADCNIPTSCAGANSLCNALGVPFVNTSNVDSAETGNDYGCLEDTPNPTWFYLPVSGAGPINLMIEQSTDINFSNADLDVDFIVYGPFDSAVAPCSDLLTEANIVDCSYSAAFVEFATIPNAQPGDVYILLASNYTGDPGYLRISETGDSEGEINCTGLRLTAFLDSNANGTKDAGEQNFALGEFHYELNADGNVHHITAPMGVHRIYDLNAANTYNLSYTINPDYLANYAITTSSYTNVQVLPGSGLQDYSFPITITTPYVDVAVTVIGNNAPMPGFTYTNTIQYTNLGSQTIASGTLIFHKDPILTITSISQTGTVPSANGFTFNYSNLLPFETRTIVVDMLVPTIPTVSLGDIVTNDAEINPFAGDINQFNNGSELSQIIIGSYDPNDKVESHGPQILHSAFTANDYLYYTIRFENTGTASAINIRVEDLLDDQLDESTVQMISASHNYVLDRVDRNLTWRFENILLPPVTPGSDEGHGYITFRVKPNPGYAVNDIIENTAYIYFDFNPAIITNTFESKFVNALGIIDASNPKFVMFPNPSKDHVTINADNGGISAITIYDISGKVVLNQPISNAPMTHTVDVAAISAGLYFVEVSSNDSKSRQKLIIK